MSDNDMGLMEYWAKIARKNKEKRTKMKDNEAALMRAWAKIAINNEGYDHRRDLAARFILDNVDDPYEKVEVGSACIVRFMGEERVAVRGDTKWYLCETDDFISEAGEAVELVSELAPKSASEHPEVLTTEEDYANAPEGTVVAGNFCHPWVKGDLGLWLGRAAGEGKTSPAMALTASRVLRWGETL